MIPQKVELLAPAGNLEKLEIAAHYGADAVYLGGKSFSLRQFCGNFSDSELKIAIRSAHAKGLKVYIACNIYPRNSDLPALTDYLKLLAILKPDALIIADPGIFELARRTCPGIPLHISTQANTTSISSTKFWQHQGATRINIARELTLEEIQMVVQGAQIEIEAFVHGAMCISYSGRCLLSNFLTARDSNRGQCSHPCRWEYTLSEKARPGQFFPIEQDSRGSYVFNSKDLCMIEHIPELISAGLAAFKIEGRMKGINYLATVVKVYREALDAYFADPTHYKVKNSWIQALETINTRGYCRGFYFGDPDQTLDHFSKQNGDHDQIFLAKVLSSSLTKATVNVRNKLYREEKITIWPRRGSERSTHIAEIADAENNALDIAQPGQTVTLTLDQPCAPLDLIKRAR